MSDYEYKPDDDLANIRYLKQAAFKMAAYCLKLNATDLTSAIAYADLVRTEIAVKQSSKGTSPSPGG